MMQKFLYWLYVKSGMRKRDMDIYWFGKLAESHRDAMDARVLWTRKMLPEITLERARELAHDQSSECVRYSPAQDGWIWKRKDGKKIRHEYSLWDKITRPFRACWGKAAYAIFRWKRKEEKNT